jgi:hypothetical protein
LLGGSPEEDELVTDFEHLQSLLRHRFDDVDVIDLIGPDPSIIQRDEYYGSVAFKDAGVELVFKEAPWVIQSSEIADSKAIYVSGFHFHRDGHDGYKEYLGRLAGGVRFSDSETEVRHKLGEPLDAGGGRVSSVLNEQIPRWLRYASGSAMTQIQLDAHGEVELVTLFSGNPKTTLA